MRELDSADFGVLLSLFALLLLAFGVDFHFSARTARHHRVLARLFVGVSLLGESASVISIVLTWVALWSPAAWARIDDLLVLVPGSIAIGCLVILTLESVMTRGAVLWGGNRADTGRSRLRSDPHR